MIIIHFKALVSPLGWREEPPPPICFLVSIYQTQTEQQTVWICWVNSEALLVSVQFMQRGYLQQQGSSSQEHAVTQIIWLIKMSFSFFSLAIWTFFL